MYIFFLKVKTLRWAFVAKTNVYDVISCSKWLQAFSFCVFFLCIFCQEISINKMLFGRNLKGSIIVRILTASFIDNHIIPGNNVVCIVLAKCVLRSENIFFQLWMMKCPFEERFVMHSFSCCSRLKLIRQIFNLNFSESY